MGFVAPKQKQMSAPPPPDKNDLSGPRQCAVRTHGSSRPPRQFSKTNPLTFHLDFHAQFGPSRSVTTHQSTLYLSLVTIIDGLTSRRMPLKSIVRRRHRRKLHYNIAQTFCYY